MDFIFHNKVIVAALVAWFIAQILKVILVLIKDRKIDLERMIGSGGMPSSHSALMVAMAASVGKYTGYESAIFAVSMCTAAVVMYDAANVRRAAGKQAELLNIIVADFYKDKHIDGEKLKELLGHTPIEVAAGAILGAFIGNVI